MSYPGGMSSNAFCPPVQSYADNIVATGWNTFQGFAREAYGIAIAQLRALHAFDVPNVALELSYDLSGNGIDFSPPSPPTRTISAFTLPTFPPEPTITIPTLDLSGIGAVPAAPDAVVFSPPARPNVSLPTAPDTTIAFDSIIFPNAPTLNLPTLASFYAITLPNIPDITIPTFNVVEPVFDTLVAPESAFTFNETPYSSVLMDSVKSKLGSMLLGGTGLPAAVEQALFDRARGREDDIAAKAVQEAYDEFATKGWEEPNGILASRVMRVRQENQNKASSLSRDIYIQAQTVEIENIRFAVTQGIALESLLVNLHMAVQERAFLVAKFALEAVLRVFDAQVAKANLQVVIYQAKAAVFRDRIQAELAKAELYKAQIDGQRLIGEINQQLVARYEAQLRALTVTVDIYRASLEAVKTRVEMNTQKIEAKRAEVEVFASQVNAYEATWRGYAAQVEGELGVVKANEVSVQAFLGRVQGWSTQNTVALERQKAQLAGEELKISKAELTIKGLIAQIEGQKDRIQAEATALGAEATVYEAGGQIAQMASAAADRALQTKIERNSKDAELQLKRGEIVLQTVLERSKQLLEALKSIGTISAQLAAASMSAVNLSAGITSSEGNSSSCQTSYSFSGEA